MITNMKGWESLEGGGFPRTLKRESSDDLSVVSFGSIAPAQKAKRKLFDGSHMVPCHLLFTIIIMMIGIMASGVFVAFGVRLTQGSRVDFEQKTQSIGHRMELELSKYELSALWIHQASHQGKISRTEFADLYNHLDHSLDFQAIGFMPHVSAEERETIEAEGYFFYAKNYPELNYHGFVGLEECDDVLSACGAPRSQQEVYYPVHYLEPLEGNEPLIGLDGLSVPHLKSVIEEAVESGAPTMSCRVDLLQGLPDLEKNEHLVQLVHPGLPETSAPGEEAGLATIVIRIPWLLEIGVELESTPILVTLEDITNAEPVFLGAVSKSETDNPSSKPTRLLSKKEADDMWIDRRSTHMIQFANREWKVTVYQLEEGVSHGPTFLSLGGICIIVACVALALYVHGNNTRMMAINRAKTASDRNYARNIIKTARQSAKAERELNDFIAHEVRNPIAAAISACSFVKSAMDTPYIHLKPNSIQSVQEDIRIIDKSLEFVNDLLRDMLDMHRASSNQLQIDLAPTDIMKDIIEPVDSMLYGRGHDFKVIAECPRDLVVMADKLRLKQIVLNLGRNATKFVTKGFIKLKAQEIDGTVVLSVEDSGPGIPPSKRALLFQKFQESLDTLSQGTGVGLCLCKNLTDLMGATLWLDDNYDSGVPDCPGTRFVINLNRSPIQVEEESSNVPNFSAEDHGPLVATAPSDAGTAPTEQESEGSSDTPPPPAELPASMKVLFVDDDTILRKLFVRALRRVAPEWSVDQAANGETAIKMAAEEEFDLIFMDQYMASVKKQLLGTETVMALRSQGVESIICGLSANDVGDAFRHAGADAFMIKPFPTEKEALKKQLITIVCASAMNEEEESEIGDALQGSVSELPCEPIPESKGETAEGKDVKANPSASESEADEDSPPCAPIPESRPIPSSNLDDGSPV